MKGIDYESSVLASCVRSRKAFEQIYGYVEEGDLSEHGEVIFSAIQKFYDRDADVRQIDAALLTRFIERSFRSEKHKRTFGHIMGEIAALDVSPENIAADFLGIRRETLGSKLAAAIASSRPTDEIRERLDEYSTILEAESLNGSGASQEIAKGREVAGVVETAFQEGLIKIFPLSLNERLGGGLLRGHHLVLFARPEMGKTLVAINMVYGFLKQNLTVLYVGNEDPLYDIVIRVVSRLSGMNKKEIIAEPGVADALAREKGYENLVLASLAPGTIFEIEELIREYSPDVLVLDQLRNLNMKEENYVQKLEKAATAARNLGKRHNLLVVSITQAGDSAAGSAVLDMGDVDYSNTGIPAACDVLVGVGATKEDEGMGRRFLSLPKNEPGGNHEFFPVMVDTFLNKVRSIT